MKKQHEYLYGKTGDTMYLFYLKGPIMNDILRESIESELELSVPEMEEIYRGKDIYPYALTFDKSMADDFIYSRNGDRFILKTEDVSAVATSGSYNDLNDKPEFETVNIDFTTEY